MGQPAFKIASNTDTVCIGAKRVRAAKRNRRNKAGVTAGNYTGNLLAIRRHHQHLPHNPVVSAIGVAVDKVTTPEPAASAIDIEKQGLFAVASTRIRGMTLPNGGWAKARFKTIQSAQKENNTHVVAGLSILVVGAIVGSALLSDKPGDENSQHDKHSSVQPSETIAAITSAVSAPEAVKAPSHEPPAQPGESTLVVDSHADVVSGSSESATGAEAAVVATDAADELPDGYRVQLEKLMAENAILVTDIDALEAEATKLNSELLERELEIVRLKYSAEWQKERQTIYNFVDVPIGDSVPGADRANAEQRLVNPDYVDYSQYGTGSIEGMTKVSYQSEQDQFYNEELYYNVQQYFDSPPFYNDEPRYDSQQYYDEEQYYGEEQYYDDGFLSDNADYGF